MIADALPEESRGETLTLSNQEITLKDFRASLTASVVRVLLEGCTSRQWSDIGGELKKHRCLQEISLVRCDAGDAICAGVG